MKLWHRKTTTTKTHQFTVATRKHTVRVTDDYKRHHEAYVTTADPKEFRSMLDSVTVDHDDLDQLEEAIRKLEDAADVL